MKKYRGEIKNEKGEVIFSRKGNFESKQRCIDMLKHRVCVDMPDHHSLIHNCIHGGGFGFKDTPYYLGRYYKDISKLTFHATELN